MTAWRSAGFNELTRSSVVGLAEGEGDMAVEGLDEAAGFPAGITVGGVCPSAVIARIQLIKNSDVNGYIGNEMPTYNAFSNRAKIRNLNGFPTLNRWIVELCIRSKG